ncbi:HDIG domain-containing metalloprotein [uncultured Prevotella sp.]|uniref:HDIG domain-containing metalloprotein n=1 Tax=uncultured Prevotella sp. TaxID=159272 RepID=UPI00280403B1|nr:HDIG domain-containing metalloprotein [uncultured Prevotella sp.]
MTDWKKIIDKYYSGDGDLRTILIIHSQSVARKALQIVSLHPELNLDREFIEEAAMLHDIGIIKTDAPGIKCFGTEPYICHGILGAEMLRQEGLPRHARVCERHTGAGLSLNEIVSQNLPLPHQDFLPETLEEQVICYADKFFSKTHLDREKSAEKAEKSIAKFGEEGLARFKQWEKMFE